MTETRADSLATKFRLSMRHIQSPIQ